jgi:hypothetical protein
MMHPERLLVLNGGSCWGKSACDLLRVSDPRLRSPYVALLQKQLSALLGISTLVGMLSSNSIGLCLQIDG